MEKEEKVLTKNELEVDNTIINDPLETLNKLLKVGNREGLNTVQISLKTGINKQALYRYSSQYESQKKTQPSLTMILKICKVLGYEIRLHKIKE